MANTIKDLVDRNSRESVRTARAERRAERQRLIYSRLHDALEGEAAEIPASCHQRQAQIWDLTWEKDSHAVPAGTHPGDTAIQLVYETFGQFSIPCDFQLRYAGMDRKAGRGSHGIAEGTIFVEGEIKPLTGFKTWVQVPLVVRGSRLLPPSFMYVAGEPRIIAQSVFDDILGYSNIDQTQYLSNFNAEEHVVPRKGRGQGLDKQELRSAIRGWTPGHGGH